MSLKNIKQQGFTIVELLIVIVVIAILAAITIVAYNGVQNRAKTTSAQAAANSAVKKAELYNTENSSYPLDTASLTTGQSGKTWELTGVTFTGTPVNFSGAPTSPTQLIFRKCGSGSPTTQTAITATNITGVQFGYYDYGASATAVSNAGTGTCPTAA